MGNLEGAVNESGQVMPVYFPVFFLGMWVAITVVLGLLSGWYGLAARYPNRPDEALAKFSWQSGMMGLGVNMNGILNLAVCRTGLRVGIFRLFGPFCRDFFVPWGDIAIVRQDRFLWKSAKLRFGAGGKLVISAHLADRLAQAMPNSWPEPGPIIRETHRQAAVGVFKEWLAATLFAAAFFTLAPRMMSPGGAHPPTLVAIIFPAVVFGIAAIFRYFGRIAR